MNGAESPARWAHPPGGTPPVARRERADRERVVATAMAVVTCLGPDLASTFDAAAEARSGIRRLTRFDPTGLACDIGGEVDLAALAAPEPFDRLGGSPWRLLRTVSLAARAREAVADVPDRQRIAIVMGGHGATPHPEDIERAVRFSNAAGQTIPAALEACNDYDMGQARRRAPDTALLLLAESLAAEGPVMPIVSACAAGSQAIGEGARLLLDDRADVVLAGGTEPLLHFSYVVGFALLGALVRRYTSPESASRPFDRKRNGFVIAEGAGLLVLERLSDARARKRPILGEVLGYGASADGWRITDMPPGGEGASRAMRAALQDAGIAPTEIQYINAHGTSTPLNDPIETLAIKDVLGAHAAAVPISSNKSMLGHTIGSAGAIEAILTFEGMRRGIVLPTRNLDDPDRRCDLDYVPHKARELAHRTALSNSFGFGGQNGCLVLGAAP